MPANYIGSSSVDKVLNKNYHGSVASKRYKAIWLSELLLHPELFSTVIVSYSAVLARANRTPEEKEATAKKYSDTMANKNPEGRSRQFFSVMNSKKTYDKGNLSKYFPEFKQYY